MTVTAPHPTRTEASTTEVMTVAAARELRDGVVCFVGIGTPAQPRISLVTCMRLRRC